MGYYYCFKSITNKYLTFNLLFYNILYKYRLKIIIKSNNMQEPIITHENSKCEQAHYDSGYPKNLALIEHIDNQFDIK